MNSLFDNQSVFVQHIIQKLEQRHRHHPVYSEGGIDLQTAAAVLFLIGPGPKNEGPHAEFDPCLIYTKRSTKVPQPGDLCFPGGHINRFWDPVLSRLITRWFSPLIRWPFWKQWRRQKPRETDYLSLLFTVGMREGFEEMRLNPFGSDFLGPLPPQSLSMFRRVIYPMAVWVRRQTRFSANWEVEKIVTIPLQNLLDVENYACYRLDIPQPPEDRSPGTDNCFPCFYHQTADETELLWGATYRMTMEFLKGIFDFHPPELNSLPVIEGHLNRHYLTGHR